MKMEHLFMIGILVIGYMAVTQKPDTTVVNGGGGSNVDLSSLVSGQASFTGQNMFLAGTAIPTEYVRVLRMNGGQVVKNLGQISLDSGAVSTTPNVKYNLYYAENGSTYYTVKEEYTAPGKEAPDDKVGVLCTIDTAPSITVFDEYGQPQSTTTEHIQSIAANAITDIEVKVKVAADECYGNPQSPVKNAICFDYNGTTFDSVKANTPPTGTPYSIGSAKPFGESGNCFELNLLKDTESQLFTVTIDAGATEPTGWHNITVSVEDVDMDLNQDSLAEIWGFQDETNNNLGASAAVTGEIRIS